MLSSAALVSHKLMLALTIAEGNSVPLTLQIPGNDSVGNSFDGM